MSIPMPIWERFALGTSWVVAAGPERWIGQRVVVTGEALVNRDDELWVNVAVIGSPEEEFEACLSWLS